jgi:hypothetical protein
METPEESVTRRNMLKATAAIGIAALGLGAEAEAPATRPQTDTSTRPSPMIGIQMGPEPLAKQDLDRLLGDLQDRAGVNTLFPFVYTYAPTTAGMEDYKNFRGGNFAMPHMQYYKNGPLSYDDMRAPEFGDVDILERSLPAIHKHGMKLFAWVIEDHSHCPLPDWEKMYEIDFHGKRALKHPAGPCFNNPVYTNFVLNLMEDYVRSYDIDGVMWGSERQGGFFNALGAYAHGTEAKASNATCFCEFCVARGKKEGIDPERARAGFIELEKYVNAGRAGKRPTDGYFVTFFRVMLAYPELLAWENMWERSREDLQVAIYTLVKSIRPELPVGWHIWHNVSFSPFHRAEIDYSRFAKFSDYLKPVLYNNCAGERIHAFIEGMTQNVFGDFDKPAALQALYRMMNYDEAPFDQVMKTGLSADYVARETKRAIDRSGGLPVWPGIDIDVPVPEGAGHCTPESIKAAVVAAFKAGAPGVLLSRNLHEMDPNHLAGAGAALDELGLR